MSRNISIYPLSEVSNFIHSLESISDRLGRWLYIHMREFLEFVGSYLGEENNVNKDKVELLFWVHKAFIIGFITALSLTSLK